MNFELTEDQKKVFPWIETGFRPYGNNVAALINGYAGTGKTTIVPMLIKKLGGSATVLALTNKAVGNMREKIEASDISIDVEYKTIHSLLYGEPNSEGKWIPSADYIENKVLAIDEASMVDRKLEMDLLEKCRKCTILYIGDFFQLEQIGDPSSIPNLNTIHLSQVVRHDNGILNSATHLRNSQTAQLLLNDDVRYTDMNNFLQLWANDVHNGVDAILVCATNAFRVQANTMLRRALGKTGPYSDDVLMAVNNTKWFSNGQVASVHSLKHERSKTISVDGKYILFDIFTARVGKETFRLINIPELAEAGFVPNSLFYKQVPATEIIDLFGYQNVHVPSKRVRDVVITTYGYAISCHKGQGSSYQNVYVNFDFCSPKWDNRRWLYTAITRAAKQVTVVPSNYFSFV